MKLQSPELEPAAVIQPPSSSTQAKPEAPKSASSQPSPPPVPSATPKPAAPSASTPATSSPAPAAPGPAPSASSPAPAEPGSASAGYAQPPAAQSPPEFLTLPNFDGSSKTLPSAQLPPPLFPSTYDWPLPAPQTACVPCKPKIKKCDWTPGKYTLLLIQKLKCLKQYIHDHCPLRKKFSKSCCQNCSCCGPMYIGTMASPQGFFGSLQSAPVWAPASASANPLIPQPSQPLPPLDFGGVPVSPDSRLALDPSAGTKPGDIAQGWEDLMPVAPQGLDKTP